MVAQVVLEMAALEVAALEANLQFHVKVNVRTLGSMASQQAHPAGPLSLRIASPNLSSTQQGPPLIKMNRKHQKTSQPCTGYLLSCLLSSVSQYLSGSFAISVAKRIPKLP